MSDILSERNKHSSESAAIMLRKVAEAIAKDRQESFKNLDTVDVRGFGRLSKNLIKYNDERFAFRNKISTTKVNYELPFEPAPKYLKLWYMMDHVGPEIYDLSGYRNHGLLEGHPTLLSVPVDLGVEQWSTEPKSIAMNFNTGTDSISALQGELIVVPNKPELSVLSNSTLYPTTKKFSIAFRFLSTTYAADTSTGTIFRRFATKRDDANNGWLCAFDDGGDLVFYVFHDGTWYQRKVDDLLINTIYEVVCTYDSGGGAGASNRIKIYIHKYTDPVPGTVTSAAVDDPTGSFLLPPDGLYDQYIGGRAQRDGYLKGWLQDFRIYAPDNRVTSRNVLTATEVKNWFTNKLTIHPTPFGNVFTAHASNLSDEALNP